jgi:DNA replication and repair protein RecF
MRIERFRGERFRAFTKFDLEAAPGLNLMTGDNAAGKTSLLEAMYVLGRGRSFRSQRAAELSQFGCEDWVLFGKCLASSNAEHRVGLRGGKAGLDIRVDGQSQATLAELAALLPVQRIDADGHALLGEGPGFRRAYLDWGVFHVEHSFLDQWRRYQRALKQRNRALRALAADAVVRSWDEELVAAGERITEMREMHVSSLIPSFETALGKLIDEPGGSLELLRGWPRGKGLREVLRDNLDAHRRLGTTAHGPHRAELLIGGRQRKVSGYLSRGQQKLMVAALVVAQAEQIMKQGSRAPILLIDDFPAELSAGFQQRFGALLRDYPGQRFVTAFEMPQALDRYCDAMFHVEHRHVERR